MFVYTAATTRRLYNKRLVGVDPEPPEEIRGIPAGKTCRKRGAVTTENKSKLIAMRFRESDYAAIRQKAEKLNMSFTEFVTTAALKKRITVIDGLTELLKEQKAIGRNLNQLTTLCNMGRIVCPDLQEVKDQYKTVLTLLNELVGRCR